MGPVNPFSCEQINASSFGAAGDLSNEGRDQQVTDCHPSKAESQNHPLTASGQC